MGWVYNDQEAWCHALEQIATLSQRWHLWMLTQAAEPTESVRIDYMLERVAAGKADVWTGEVGEQGYSMGGIDPVVVFNAVLDTVSPEVQARQSQRNMRGKGGGQASSHSHQGHYSAGSQSNSSDGIASSCGRSGTGGQALGRESPSTKRPLSSSSLQG